MPTKQPRAAPFQRCPPATCPATAPPSPYFKQPPGRASAELGAAARVSKAAATRANLRIREPPVGWANVMRVWIVPEQRQAWSGAGSASDPAEGGEEVTQALGRSRAAGQVLIGDHVRAHGHNDHLEVLVSPE